MTFSAFNDPRASVPMQQYHHRHYEGREPSWYIPKIAHGFRGRKRVLDVGCGPGLCMQALLNVGVEEVVGLERDPLFLEKARKAGLRVIPHDLNLPFPFLKSEAFDGVVAYQTFDFLVHAAKIVCLRECWRVLKPGGKIAVYAQSTFNPQAQKDPARIGAVTPGELKNLLQNAGFQAISLEDNKAYDSGQVIKGVSWTPEIPEERYLTANAIAHKPDVSPRSSLRMDSPNFLEAWPAHMESAWTTAAPCLYQRGPGGLGVLSGAKGRGDRLWRSSQVRGDFQVSACLESEAQPPGRGGMEVAFAFDAGSSSMRIGVEGRVTWDSKEEIDAGVESDGLVGVCVRLQKSSSHCPEAAVWLWRGERQAASTKLALKGPVRSMTVSFRAEPGSRAFLVDHVSVLAFPEARTREVFDAQVLTSVSSRGGQGGRKLTQRKLSGLFEKTGVQRALIVHDMTRRAGAGLFAFQEKYSDRVFPLIRLPGTWNARERVLRRWRSKLEALWRSEQMIGVAVRLPEEQPHSTILQWMEQRRVLTLWHPDSEEDMQWLEDTILRLYHFPAILASFDGNPADLMMCQRAVEWAEKYPQLFVTTLLIPDGAMLAEAAKRAPHRLVFGSRFPASDPVGAKTWIEALDIDEAVKQRILFHNMDGLVRTVHFFRQGELRMHQP